MNEIIQSDGLVQASHGQVMTTSRVIAEKFGKNHRDVLRAIKNLDCSAEYHQRNFAQVLIDVPGHRGAIRKMPMYSITRDGFIFLVTGFTGKKAATWKEKFIGAFNAMEKELLILTIQKNDAHWQQVRQEGKCIRLGLTDTIQNFVNYATSQGSQNAHMYYMSITKMEYKALEFVKKASDKQFRDKLNTVQNTQLSVIELAAQEALRRGMDEGLHYKDCYLMAREACEEVADTLKRLTPYSTQIGNASPAVTGKASINTKNLERFL